jgi:hypothetical protein
MQQLKKIMALLLVPVILITGIGFSVSQHYCLGMLKSESFYSPAEKCAMHENEAGCEKSQASYRSNCCEDQNLSIAGLEFKRLNEHQGTDVFLATFPLEVNHMQFVVTNTSQKPVQNLNLHPPEKLLIAYQCFLI